MRDESMQTVLVLNLNFHGRAIALVPSGDVDFGVGCDLMCVKAI